MLYIKPDNATRIEITDQNVFTTCPTCGREIRVDLIDMLQDPDFDLYGTQVVCADCARTENTSKGDFKMNQRAFYDFIKGVSALSCLSEKHMRCAVLFLSHMRGDDLPALTATDVQKGLQALSAEPD